MKTTQLGSRDGVEYYLDLREGWRMGDFAGVRMLLTDWRQKAPSAKLTVSYGNHHWRSVYGNQLDLPWVFADVADVLHEMEGPTDLIPNHIAMVGKSILGHVLSAHIWNDWARLRDNVVAGHVKLPTMTLPADVLERTQAILDKKGIKGDYITLHPLFDAGYNTYRNGRTAWWDELMLSLRNHVQVVVLGTHDYLQHINVPSGVHHVLDLGIPAMESLGLISKAKLHIGGETGLTLWAGVCAIPVLAAYGRWSTQRDSRRRIADFRPIPFAKPVVHAPLNGDVNALVQMVVGMCGGAIPKMRTPEKLPPSVARVVPMPPRRPPKRMVRAPKARPLPAVRTVKTPIKTLKQLLAERRARRA